MRSRPRVQVREREPGLSSCHAAKSSIVLFSVGNRIDIQLSIVISRVAGRLASRRASVDFPAAIFPQRRCNVVGQAVFIVTDCQLPALSSVIHSEANLQNASQVDDSPVSILLQKSLRRLIDSSTDKILFGVASPPEKPSSLSETAQESFSGLDRGGELLVLLQRNLPKADVSIRSKLCHCPSLSSSAGM